MNPLRLETKRILFSTWTLPSILMASTGLAYMTYRIGVYPQQKEPLTCLALLLGNVEYHVFLFALIAIAMVGLDVSARIPRLETQAGGSPLRFLQRKVILYIVVVLACELLYFVVPLLLWGISSDPFGRLLPARLFLYLGIAMPFFLLQAVLPSLQAMLIGDALGAILWIVLFDNDLNTWYLAVLGLQDLPMRWFLFSALSIVVSIITSYIVYKLRLMESI